jgi:hypothetical protein
VLCLANELFVANVLLVNEIVITVLMVVIFFFQVDGLIPNRKYRIKLQVNARFRPKPAAEPETKGGGKSKKKMQHQDNPDEIRLRRVGYFEVRTAPCEPAAPTILTPDVMHFDHVNESKKSSLTSKASRHNKRGGDGGGDDESDPDTASMSIVDKLEFFKKKQANKTAKKPSNKHTGTIFVIIFPCDQNAKKPVHLNIISFRQSLCSHILTALYL